jgi:hypothetical protein
MMWLSALVAAACVLASLRRLTVAVAPTSLDAEELCKALTGRRAFRRLWAAIEAAPRVDWERGLMTAFAEHDERVREALVNELLTEVNGRTTAWSRVPRICASVATSAGFLFALITLLRTWGEEESPLTVGPALISAVNVFSLGIVGGAFCGVIHVRAMRAERASLGAIDRLVERMQSLTDALPQGLAGEVAQEVD